MHCRQPNAVGHHWLTNPLVFIGDDVGRVQK